MLYPRVLFQIVLFAASTSTAFCDIMLVIDPTSPDGQTVHNVVRDTDTGLDWLVWTPTHGLSYNEIIALSGPSGPLEGWAHANRGQVKTLFDNIRGNTIFTANWPSPTVLHDLGEAAISILAHVDDTSLAFFSLAYTSDEPFEDHKYAVTVSVVDGNSVTDASTNVFHVSERSSIHGHALIRQSPSGPAVPEPSSIVLLGLGAIGLCYGQMRRRRKLPVA